MKPDYLDLVPVGLVYMDSSLRIVQINEFAMKELKVQKEAALSSNGKDLFPALEIEQFIANLEAVTTVQFEYGGESFVGTISSVSGKGLIGCVLVFQRSTDLEELSKELDSYRNLSLDLQAIFDSSYDVIYVADGAGITLRVSSACERLWGLKESQLVGKSVFELEREGVFRPSITRLVLERKEKVSFIQTTKTGRRLMVVGTPIKDEQGNMIRVVNASRDITQISQLQGELEEMKVIMEGYKKELTDLRSKSELKNQIISQSPQMKKVIAFSQKIAKVDSTVLLLGESGVGKEVVASYIHKLSSRHNKPFLMLSCGMMPENLLEAELFGMDRKLSLFELANEGTLFIDEIDEMPFSLQMKLLRALQDKEIAQPGGNRPVTINIRLIAATQKNLADQVKQGKFREDLYYLLNIVPITIPPLRERKEDIIPLILHFTKEINRKYGIGKRFVPQVLKKLQDYSWMGNVRELQNIVERMMVTSDGEWIDLDQLPDHMRSAGKEKDHIRIESIMPLNKAIEIVEKELIGMAQKKYGSTTKIAKILGVNQSTISRKMQKYLKNED
jgi:PAS domain S-box-containing protein